MKRWHKEVDEKVDRGREIKSEMKRLLKSGQINSGTKR